ncbi:MAG: hypothetical protein JSU63_00690 [Phycisphaerales bacterium]|nr:MAG: hypothetical protein JSU63_00690 [Phycisphaerales bacterium]
MKKIKTRTKLVVLANVLLASCWGWSCIPDTRDAFWAGVMDYVTGATTDTLNTVWSPADMFPEE